MKLSGVVSTGTTWTCGGFMRQDPFGDLIATNAWDLERPDGSLTCLTARVGRPYQDVDGVWLCPAEIDGLERRYPDIAGESSLQAISLALTLIRSRMEWLVTTGRVLRCPSGGEQLGLEDIAAIFGRNGSP